MRKRVFEDMGNCPLTESLDTIECFKGDFAHMQDDANPHILHMLEGTFLLESDIII